MCAIGGKNCTKLEHCLWGLCCTMLAEPHGFTEHTASGCFKWQYENAYDVPELQCETKTVHSVCARTFVCDWFQSNDGVRYCVGFESPAMIYGNHAYCEGGSHMHRTCTGSVRTFLWPLLSQQLRVVPAETFAHDIDEMLEGVMGFELFQFARCLTLASCQVRLLHYDVIDRQQRRCTNSSQRFTTCVPILVCVQYLN
jgi:hypothetical protein